MEQALSAEQNMRAASILTQLVGSTALHACRAVVEGRVRDHASPSEKTAVLDAIQREWAETNLRRAGLSVTLDSAIPLRQGERYIIVSNHLSLADVPVIIVGLPLSVRFVAKKELSWVPIFGPGMEACGHIVIDRSRGREAYERMRVAVDEAGTSLAIFAEGTRSRDGHLLPFKSGAFHLATETGLPILPVALHGTREVWPPDSLRIRTDQQVTVRVAPSISPEGLGPEQLRERVRVAIQGLL